MPRCWVVSCCLAVLLATVQPPDAAICTDHFAPVLQDPPRSTSALITLPVVAERRYSITARIRPLLLFWISRDDVGGARVRWYRGEGGERGFELLLGSDPKRAPREVNRWGYVAEEARAGILHTFGVMKDSDEQTIEEAQARMAAERQAGHPFRMIRERLANGEVVTDVRRVRTPRDFTYREIDTLLAEFARLAPVPEIKRVQIGTAARVGLLGALTDLIHEDAEAMRRTRPPRGIGRRSLAYVFNARLYTLSLASSQFVATDTYGGRTYARLARADFEVSRPGYTWKERFSLVYPLEGPEAEIPVFASYQPRWWFKAELVLDQQETF